jgi:CheY-like chemotaxis protein
MIDDEPNTITTFSICLESEGYAVSRAFNGKEGLEKVEAFHPDLVLLDLKMPQIDGMEVLSRIKKKSPETIVIMMSAFGTPELENEAKAKGALKFLNKPLSPGEIREAVKGALEAMEWSKRRGDCDE